MEPLDFAKIEIGNLENRIEELLKENELLKDGNLIVWSSNNKLQTENEQLKGALKKAKRKKMKIRDDWEFDDLVTGLKFKVEVGKSLDRLHIENIGQGGCDNRDLWFTKDGDFDGTGSSDNKIPDDINSTYEEAKAAAESKQEHPK